MSNKYTITVENNSGSFQTYALFTQPPQVTGSVQGQIWSNVFATAKTPEVQTATFTVYKQYYAVCGSSSGSPAAGIQVNVGQTHPVTLGLTEPDGTVVPGTSVTFYNDQGAPAFEQKLPTPSAFANCFEIDTLSDFTIQTAEAGNWMIGLGGSSTGSESTGPASTFIPEPNVQYQIQPVNTYYVSFGSFTQSALVDIDKIGTKCKIDFTKYPSGKVTINHDDKGELVIVGSS